MRLDLESWRKTAKVELESQPARLACGDGIVWASSPSSGTVTEISANTAEPRRTIRVGRGASALAVGSAGLWVTNPVDGKVSRIDPRTGEVTAAVRLGAATAPPTWRSARTPCG